MYPNPYNNSQSYIQELQSMRERIDRQLQQASQPQQTPNINQTFQLAPSHNTMKYASTIDDVNKELVFTDTPFFAKDLSVMWLKNTKGEVKAYELKELIQKDEKDLMIENLQLQIDELKKGMMKNAKSDDDYIDEPTQDKKSTNVSNSRTSKTK